MEAPGPSEQGACGEGTLPKLPRSTAGSGVIRSASNCLIASVDLRALERGYTRTQTSVGESMRVPRIEHDQRYPVEFKS